MSVFDSDVFNERLFFPRPDVSRAPAGAVDRRIRVEGAELHLRLHAADGARATVLFFHGNGEVVADYDSLAPEFARAGATLAVVDFRGYGASTGVPTLRSAIADAAVVLGALRSEPTVQGRPLIVMGRSLGSACAIELYGRGLDEVAGVVIESGALDLVGLVRRRGLSLDLEAVSEADRAVFDPLPKLARGRLPLLVLHGEEDTLIAATEAERAYAAAGTPTEDKHLVLVPRRGHNDVALADAYWEALGSFVRTTSSS